ncbi:hypothetical protein TWF718_005012 [Orbilia javanica]|uniref:WD40 repeat-like protein n=1 Tax=Orbilia javanica TaxID=47235 RepID=A0AAN8RR16_9PEZI
MITSTTWVPRGFAAEFPDRKTLDEDEFSRIAEIAKLKLDDAEEDLEDAKAAESDDDGEDNKEGQNNKKDTNGGGVSLEMDIDEKEKKKDDSDDEAADDDLKEYNLDTYDDDVAGDDDPQTMGMFGNIKSLAYHENNDEDPYITIPDNQDDSERDELQILPTDNLLLAGRFEDDLAHLEIYVYEDDSDNLYVHHDLMLPAIPLCIEWLDLPVKTTPSPTTKGNFAAIGTTDPDIEIWNLDTVDSLFPDAILGAPSTTTSTSTSSTSSKKKKKKKSKTPQSTHHTDSILSLSSNRTHRNLLASGSADTTIKLWDLTTCSAAHSYTHHTDKVSSLSWHPTNTTILLSGSWDRTIAAVDMRTKDTVSGRWGVESDVEGIKWDPHDPNYFYISTDAGNLHLHDARTIPSSLSATKPVWTLQAHSSSLTSFDVNPIIPGFIATASTDKNVKIWNVEGNKPSMVTTRDFDLGKIFSVGFAPDKAVGFRLAIAGSEGVVKVWDTSTNAAVRRIFAGRVPEGVEEKEERVVGVEDSDSDSDSEDGEEPEEDGKQRPDGWESMSEED